MAKSLVKRDAEIQQLVLQELRWDSRVKASEIGVAVEEGVVRLTGTVDTYAEKLAAQEAAHRVVGVLDVANDVVVSPPGSHARTDLDVARAVRWELEWNVLVPHEQIRSTVSDGWVTLEGKVNTWQQRTDAETAIRYLPGVRGITNRLAVAGPSVDAAAIRRAIEEALERRAEREARRIQVEVHDGAVVLTGVVRSWFEKQAVIGAAGHALGIRDVEDRLEIDPYS